MNNIRKDSEFSPSELESLFSADVVVHLSTVEDYYSHLHCDEKKCVQNAIAKRRREFSTGRYCAHGALRDLGVESGPILSGEKREPLWPVGIKGSISHSSTNAVAVVSRDPLLISVGLDVESAEAISDRIRDMVCTKQDIENLGIYVDNPIYWKLIFSAKESIYKCLFPIVRKWIGFSHANLQFDFPSGRFIIKMDESLEIPRDYLDAMQGRFILSKSQLFTCVEIIK